MVTRRQLLTERYGTRTQLNRELHPVVLSAPKPPAAHPNADRAAGLLAAARAGLDDTWWEDHDG